MPSWPRTSAQKHPDERNVEGRAERSLPGLWKGFHFIDEQAEAQHKCVPQRNGDQPSALQIKHVAE